MMLRTASVLGAPAALGLRKNSFAALAAVFICIAALWAWTAGLSGPYHFDDFATPLNDPASQSVNAWIEYLPVTLRPATKLTYALEAEAGWIQTPAPRRLISLAIHVCSALLLFTLIVRLVPASPPLLAVALAGIWFLHPVHADNVLMLSGRSAALSGLLLLAALSALEGKRAWWAGLLFVLACLARETALAGLLPLTVLVASQPGVSFRSAMRALAPALLGAALILWWILTTPRYMHLAEFSFLGRPFWQSVASQVGAVPVGLGLLFNPSALSIDYGIPLPRRLHEPVFLLGIALYVGAAAGIVVFLKRSRAVAVGLALWLAALMPTQSFVPKLDALTNRPLSLALAGLLIAAAPVLAVCFMRLLQTTTRQEIGLARRRLAKGMAVAGVVCAMVLFVQISIATERRTGLFESSIDLWGDAAAKSTTNARPHFQYALLLKSAGLDVAALAAAEDAHEIDPFNAHAAVMVRAWRTFGRTE